APDRLGAASRASTFRSGTAPEKRSESMVRLYQFATSPFCAKVRKILDYKGAEYELSEVDYLDRDELLRASGGLIVPAITLENGETLTDSDRIAQRLEQAFPAPSIFPP